MSSLPTLPNDIILQILSHLPTKLLFQLKSLSKSFQALLSSPHFKHLHNHNNSLSSLILQFDQSQSLLSLLGPTTFCPLPSAGLVLRASSNGLLCCSSSSPNRRGLFVIVNPSTRESRALPPVRERAVARCHPEYEDEIVGLAADWGRLGFTVVLAGFRRAFGCRPGPQLECHVFDSGTNLWHRSVVVMHDEFTHMNRCQAVFAHGAIHWLTSAGRYVLAFDLEAGVWGKVSLPDEVVGGRHEARAYLLELEGAVSVVQISGVWMSVWVLIGDDQWELVDRVHLRCINVFAASVFPVAQNREVVFMATQKKILTYHRRSKMWREVYSVKGSVAYPLWFSAYGFRSTLFPCNYQQ